MSATATTLNDLLDESGRPITDEHKKLINMQPTKQFVNNRIESIKEVDWVKLGVKTFWFASSTFWVVMAIDLFMLMQWTSLLGLIYLGMAAGCAVFGLAA